MCVHVSMWSDESFKYVVCLYIYTHEVIDEVTVVFKTCDRERKRDGEGKCPENLVLSSYYDAEKCLMNGSGERGYD